MQMTIHGHHLEITDPIREHVKNKLSKLERHYQHYQQYFSFPKYR